MRTLACLLLVTSLLAQDPVPAPGATKASADRPELGPAKAIPEGAPTHLALIHRQALQAHAYWLADDARAGRYTGSKAQQETAKYIADHFKSLGLKPLGDRRGFLQSFPLLRTALEAATSLTIGSEKITTGFAVLAASNSMKLSKAGKFVWCGNGTDEQVPKELGGRIPIVVLEGGGGQGGAGADLQAIQRYKDIARRVSTRGAELAIVCLLDDKGSLANTLNYHALLPDHARFDFKRERPGLDLAATLFVLSTDKSQQLLQFAGRSDAGIDGKAAGKVTIAVKQDEKATSSNVVAVLEGTSKKSEAIVFSAHHDHVGRRLDGDTFNGADDNASGTAGLLCIAEAFARGGDRPARSIVFLSVSGEELGLWGSEWFADNPTWPLDKIVADINIDMIGRAGGSDDAIEMQVTPSHAHDKYSTLVQEAVALGGKFGIRFQSGDQYYARSDHYNFAKRDVPVVFFCDGEHPDYHQVTDSADRLDYGRMEAIARLAFWSGWNAAESKQRPRELGAQVAW